MIAGATHATTDYRNVPSIGMRRSQLWGISVCTRSTCALCTVHSACCMHEQCCMHIVKRNSNRSHVFSIIIIVIIYVNNIYILIRCAVQAYMTMRSLSRYHRTYTLPLIQSHTLNVVRASDGGGNKDIGIGLNIHAIQFRQHSVAVRSLKHTHCDFVIYLILFLFYFFLPENFRFRFSPTKPHEKQNKKT